VEGREEGDGSKQEERATRLQQGERISESGGTEATMHKMSEGMRRDYSSNFFPILREGGGIGVLLETVLLCDLIIWLETQNRASRTPDQDKSGWTKLLVRRYNNES
jgi:hypothetical protein